LNHITKSKKTCALLGDFNADLINYGTHSDITSFYDLISSHSFRPLILQPTRLRTKTGTLIDNIFINDLACTSKSGNSVTSISDHLVQFSQIDLFDPPSHPKASTKTVRNWRIFNKREFADELSAITWDDINDPNAKEKDPIKKERLGSIYRTYRNRIVSFLRSSKKDYHTAYFEEHKENMKKTQDGIRNPFQYTHTSAQRSFSTILHPYIHNCQ
jgi:hypothetical protein